MYIISTIVIIILLVSCQRVPEPNHSLTLMLKPSEIVDYDIELNHSIIKSGVLEKTWNKVVVPNKEGTYSIYYKNKRYYTNTFEFQHTNSISNITVTHELPLTDQKGNISIWTDKPLVKNATQKVWLTVKGTKKNIVYCFYWTTGIISVKMDDTIYCNQGIWTNTTQYGNLADNEYLCGRVKQKCKTVINRRCQAETVPIPDNLKADICYYSGESIQDSEVSKEIEVQTMFYHDWRDFINVTILDMDLTPESRLFNKRIYSISNDAISEKII